LPIQQLLLLALLSLAEQTALNSIGPYIYYLVLSLPEIPSDQVGLYVGILASAFALAQLSTNLLWGYLSDKLGRKPVLLAGTAMLTACFAFFGFCQRYWQVVLCHALMGLLNGNAAIVPTVLGELTDRSTQTTAFTWLPVIYSLGSITGPALGGKLVNTLGDQYPYLAPNLVSAVLLAISVAAVGFWFDETHQDVAELRWDMEGIRRRLQMFREKPRESSESSSENLLGPPMPSASRGGPEEENPFFDGAVDERPVETGTTGPPWRDLLNHTTLILLVTYLVFQLSNASFNSLYPVFAAADPPAGRGLDPGFIGLSLSFAGVATIVFQTFLFQPLKARVGNMSSYRYTLFGMAICMGLIPWVGYVDSRPAFGAGKWWLYAELGIVLVVKNICAVGGLSSVMLLVSFPLFSLHGVIVSRFANV
jgi:MFS family permease